MKHLTSLDTDVGRYRRHGVIPRLFLNLSDLFPHLSREILPPSIPSSVGWKLKATVMTSYSLCCPLWPQDCLQPARLSPFLPRSCRWPPGVLCFISLCLTAVVRVTLAASSSFPFFSQVTWHQDFRVRRKLRDHHLLRDRRDGTGLSYPGRHTSQLLFPAVNSWVRQRSTPHLVLVERTTAKFFHL